MCHRGVDKGLYQLEWGNLCLAPNHYCYNLIARVQCKVADIVKCRFVLNCRVELVVSGVRRGFSDDPWGISEGEYASKIP